MCSSLSKTELRRQVTEEIAALPDDYVFGSDKGLFHNATSLKEFLDARNIMIYHSVKREPDTLELAKTALQMGKTVAFPHCIGGGVMHALVVKSLKELEPGMLGIPAPPKTAPLIAPDELDLIFVPALTFDLAGHRLGYGGGYYDRFLSGIPAFTVGMARERLLRRVLTTEPHDIAVKCVITEFGIRN